MTLTMWPLCTGIYSSFPPSKEPWKKKKAGKNHYFIPMIFLVLGIHLTTILIGWQQHQKRRTQLHSTSFLLSAFSFWWLWSSLSSASSKGLIIYRSIENYFFCRERMVKRMNKSGSESCTSWNTNSLKDLEVGVFI